MACAPLPASYSNPELTRLRPTLAASHPFELQASFIMTVVSFSYGFFRVTSPDSDVPCEMLAFFFYYRTSIMLGLWVHIGLQEGALLLTKLTLWLMPALQGGAVNKKDAKQVDSRDF